jgi:hypothetical protein
MLKGPLNTFIVLTGRIIELFYDWLKRVDSAFRLT